MRSLSAEASTPSQDAGATPPSPLQATTAASAEWHQTCDVLVAGFGAAGAAAAIAAHDAGAEVLIAERFAGGGATRKSGGVIYAGGGTPQQLASGVQDSVEAMAAYLAREVGDAVSEATLRRFCADSRELLAWLQGMGVRFAPEARPPKTSYPKNGVYLYYSGNEAVPENAAVAPPAPRGHRVVAEGMSGAALFDCLQRAVADRGIRVCRQAGVRRLITDAQGRVLGAELAQLPPGSRAAKRQARLIRRAEALHNAFPAWADRLRARAAAIEAAEAVPLRVRARKGVLLATGGFIFNRAMVAEHAPAFLPAMRLGATGCDGSGILLGQSAGGATARLDKVSAWRFINPPSALPSGIIVDAAGRRFCNEEVYGATLGVRMCAAHDGRAWLIVDRHLRRKAIREALFGRLWAFQSIPALLLLLFAPRAKRLADLARRLALPAGRLEAAVDAMNRAIDRGEPDPLGKSDGVRRPLSTPPFYALDISAGNALFPCPAITLGGLRVGEDDGAVLRGDGSRIPGLFAAGRAAVGVASNGYVSGLSLADCLWSGRRAGQTMAAGNGVEDSAVSTGAADAA